MSLTGKLVSQVEIKSSGDVFHELFRNKPHEISKISPDSIQGCDLHEGEWGTVGSVIYWKYTHGKLVSQVEIKSNGDVFHELVRHKPHEISKISPDCVQGCDLHEGDWGTVGSVIYWKYTHDGKQKVAKEIIESIDEEKKLVTLKVIEGDLLELYKSFSITVHVDTHGESNLVTWILGYEKLNENIPDPNTVMELVLKITKDIETHHLIK